MAQSIHEPDQDLKEYLIYGKELLYTLDDIKTIHASIPGENEENDWFWVIELKDGQFIYTQASCCFLGWDCETWGNSQLANTPQEAAHLAPDWYHSRNVQQDMLNQISGEQEFGTTIIIS